MTLTERLREAIRTAPSVYSVAKATGVPHPVLGRFLSGERDIRLATVEKIAEWAGLELTLKATKGNAAKAPSKTAKGTKAKRG
jgi:DNA-binding phage protein